MITKYRKKTREFHPDKFENASETEKKDKTAKFQELNNAYKRIMNYVLENNKKSPDDAVNDTGDDDEETFMKENFGHFNFPRENNGSFTVIIQHYDADIWQKCLEEKYGEPNVIINEKGTVCDRLWKFRYDDNGRVSDLTLHI